MIIQHEETGRLATDWPSALPIPKGWAKVACEHLFDGVLTPQTEADLYQHPRPVKVGVIIPNTAVCGPKPSAGLGTQDGLVGGTIGEQP